MSLIPPMTGQMRYLTLKVHDGYIQNLPILFQMQVHARYEEMLLWLLRNGFTGRELVTFLNYECNHSFFELFHQVCSRIDKEKERRPIIYGKDWLPG